MSFRSIIQEMKGSKLRSRSSRSRIFDQSGVSMIDALKQSRWANMSAELLRDVLKRIEESESSWPTRKVVVTCAGVCRSWREIVKEIVKLPEFSGRITFPISLKQPGPSGLSPSMFHKEESHESDIPSLPWSNPSPNLEDIDGGGDVDRWRI